MWSPFTNSPISAGTLAGEIHAVVRIVVLLVHDLGEAEVCDFDLPTHVALSQQDVAGLQVVVDHGRLDFVQVFEGGYYLHDDGPRLPLWDCFMLEMIIAYVSSVD